MIALLRLLFVFLVVGVVSAVANAQDYATSIVGTDFDIITDDDPSCFVDLAYEGIKSVEMPDKTSDGELFQDAHLFKAFYSDNSEIRIAVDSSFEDAAVAKREALRYATRLGKLPTVLRAGVRRLVVHEGHENTTAFSDHGLIVVYSGNATKRISTNDLEETLFHESVHAAWDEKYAKSADWKRAQAADGAFATMYAKKKPVLEDLAESALFAYAVIHHIDRLPPQDAQRIKTQIPSRILFVEKLIPLDKPIFFDANSVACDVDIRRTGIANDILANTLRIEYGMTESEVSDCLENLGDALVKGAAERLKLDLTELRSKLEKHKHVNCEHAQIKNAVDK